MPLSDKVLQDFKDAMKSKDSIKVSVLSFLRAQMSYAALEKKKAALDDGEIIAVIKKLVKQHQDSIEQFAKGGRQDLVEKEERELAVLKSYLPKEMPPEELSAVIEEVITSTGAAGMKDMGKVMKEVMAKTGGKADSKTVSDKVKERLSKPA
ncbi:MAG: GatB/YqeY domain-containing protein [Deltaproteobacteria bacterium]